MKINEKIKQLRTENKMTQKEFANKTGLSISAVQKYEYGDLTPSESVLFKISRQIPLSFGCFGPGEKIILLGFIFFISSIVIASFLTVITSLSVISFKYCSTLNTNES